MQTQIIVHDDFALINGVRFIREDTKPETEDSPKAVQKGLVSLKELTEIWGIKSKPHVSKIVRGLGDIGESIAFKVGSQYRINAEKAEELFKKGDVQKMKEHLQREGRW